MTVPLTPGQRAAAHEMLRAVLDQRAFAQGRHESWWTLTRRAVGNWIMRVFGDHAGSISAARVGWVLAWTLSIAALVVLIVALIRMLRPQRSDAPASLHVPSVRRTASRELALQAAALARAGDTREASRVAYRAGIRRLEEEGALTADEARTPRESLRALAAGQRRRPALTRLTSTFERIWYAAERPAPEDAPALIALLQELECLSREHAN